MPIDDLDQILSKEPEVVPSSGFLANVMGAVQQKAVAPPPIPFPWARALPGIAAVVLGIGMLVGMTIMAFARGAATQPIILPSSINTILEQAKALRPGWIILALIVSFVSIKLSARLALRRS